MPGDSRDAARRRSRAAAVPASNPFATRFVAPGKLPWFEEGPGSIRIEQLAARLSQELHNRAEIVGPHGSGKSTLLRHLAEALGGMRVRLAFDGSVSEEDPAGRIVWLQLRASHHPRNLVRQSRQYWGPERILMIDGFEQLGWLSRWWVLQSTWIRRQGLVVTRHRAGALPALCHTHVSANTASRIVKRLIEAEVDQRPWLRSLADAAQLEERLKRQDGNFREVLMELFDAVQQGPPLGSQPGLHNESNSFTVE